MKQHLQQALSTAVCGATARPHLATVLPLCEFPVYTVSVISFRFGASS